MYPIDGAEWVASPTATDSGSTETLSAADLAVQAGDVATFREVRTAERSGKPLEAPKAASPTAQPGKQAASTDATSSAASEPAKTDITPKKNAETRVSELLAERYAKDREIAELKAQIAGRPAAATDAKPAESSTAKPAAIKFPEFSAYLEKNPDASYDDYLSAKTEHVTRETLRLDREERESAVGRQKALEAHTERTTVFVDRVQAAFAVDATLKDKIDPQLHQLTPSAELAPWSAIKFGNVVADQLLVSSNPVALMLHLSNREEVERLSNLSPAELFRAFGMIEAGLPKLPTKEDAASAVKTVTSAPEPTTTLGRKAADPADPAEAAVKSGDVAAFRRVRQAERVATLAR